VSAWWCTSKDSANCCTASVSKRIASASLQTTRTFPTESKRGLDPVCVIGARVPLFSALSRKSVQFLVTTPNLLRNPNRLQICRGNNWLTDGPNRPNGWVRDGPGTPSLRSAARAAAPDCDDSCSAFVTAQRKVGRSAGVRNGCSRWTTRGGCSILDRLRLRVGMRPIVGCHHPIRSNLSAEAALAYVPDEPSQMLPFEFIWRADFPRGRKTHSGPSDTTTAFDSATISPKDSQKLRENTAILT